ncbi:MAG: hypothetical protein K0U40_02955 [Betaproteobacteria bacterium]|nr:hypothetical protein [Betaproteobacteria bacterium]
MTDKKEHKQAQIEQQLALKASEDSLSKNKRRRLLKGAVALPVIMTLHSGAALARTSNMIGDAPAVDAQVDMEGRLLCAHPDPTQPQIAGGPYDLGMMPSGHYEKQIDGNGPISLDNQAINCRAGGGVVISGVAYTSIMSRSGFNIM